MQSILKKIGFFCIIFYSSMLFAQQPSIINEIDSLYESRNLTPNLEKSIQIIDDALSSENSEILRYELLWRYARQVSAAKNYIQATKDEKLVLYEKGLNRSAEAKKLKPNDINAMYWHAIVLGRQAELKGVMNSLGSVKPIKKSMDSIINQNPNFSRAYFVLSRLYRKAPKLISIGNPKKALENINMALKLDPNDSIYLLEKARVLIKLKKKEDAKKQLKNLIIMPVNPIYFKDQVLRDKKQASILLDSLSK